MSVRIEYRDPEARAWAMKTYGLAAAAAFLGGLFALNAPTWTTPFLHGAFSGPLGVIAAGLFARYPREVRRIARVGVVGTFGIDVVQLVLNNDGAFFVGWVFLAIWGVLGLRLDGLLASLEDAE